LSAPFAFERIVAPFSFDAADFQKPHPNDQSRQAVLFRARNENLRPPIQFPLLADKAVLLVEILFLSD
jgi:hypothetical protein